MALLPDILMGSSCFIEHLCFAIAHWHHLMNHVSWWQSLGSLNPKHPYTVGYHWGVSHGLGIIPFNDFTLYCFALVALWLCVSVESFTSGGFVDQRHWRAKLYTGLVDQRHWNSSGYYGLAFTLSVSGLHTIGHCEVSKSDLGMPLCSNVLWACSYFLATGLLLAFARLVTGINIHS